MRTILFVLTYCSFLLCSSVYANPTRVAMHPEIGDRNRILGVLNSQLIIANSSQYGSSVYAFDGESPFFLAKYSGEVGPLRKIDSNLPFYHSYGSVLGQYGISYYEYDGNNIPVNVGSPTSLLSPHYIPNKADVLKSGVLFDGDYYLGWYGYMSPPELWKYSENDQGEVTTEAIPGTRNIEIASMTVFNEKLYLSASMDNGTGIELFVYDGINPPSLVADLYPGENDSEPHLKNAIEMGGNLYFTAFTNDSAIGLWKYDGINSPELVNEFEKLPVTGGVNHVPSLAVMKNKLYLDG